MDRLKNLAYHVKSLALAWIRTICGKRTTLGSREKTVPFYDPPITSVTDGERQLLEGYSHIAPEEVIPKIIDAVRIPPTLLAH